MHHLLQHEHCPEAKKADMQINATNTIDATNTINKHYNADAVGTRHCDVLRVTHR